MKTRILVVLAVIVTAIISFALVKDYMNEGQLFGGNVESLTYGEGPGDENHRHNQAANCPTDFYCCALSFFSLFIRC